MKTRWQELRAKHWSSRSVYERRILTIAGVFLLPTVYYFLLWEPAHRAVAKLRVSLPMLQAQNIKLNAQAVEIDTLRHRPQLAALDASALKISIEDSASRNQVLSSITTLDTQEPNAVRISCDSIAFSVWIEWLRSLQQEQHVRADSITISALPLPGMVKVSATLINGSTQ